MAGVVRQKREYGIAPIGVARTSGSSQPLAQAIISGADALRERYYTQAVEAAKERGARKVAELTQEQITTLDEGTKEPIAMALTEGMGRIEASAFRDHLLSEFETSINDDMASYADILMQRVSSSRNAPKLFEQAFSEYAAGLGEDSSGFYQGVIRKYGEHYLEQGRTKLKVAQIARLQDEAKRSKENFRAKTLERAFNLGAGIKSAFMDTIAKSASLRPNVSAQGVVGAMILSEEIDGKEVTYAKLGVSSDAGRKKFKQDALAAFAQGVLQSGMQNSNVALDSQKLRLYFLNPNNTELYSTLSQDSKDLIESIEAITTPDNMLDYIKFANENEATFRSGAALGTAIAADRQQAADIKKAELTRGIKLAEEAAEAEKNLNKNQTQEALALLEDLNRVGTYKNIGFSGDQQLIEGSIASLNGYLTDLQFYPEDNEKLKKIKTEIFNARSALAAGVLSKALNGINTSSEAAKKRLSRIKTDIENGTNFNLTQFLLENNTPEYEIDVILTSVNQNKTQFGKILDGFIEGRKLDIDQKDALKTAQLEQTFTGAIEAVRQATTQDQLTNIVSDFEARNQGADAKQIQAKVRELQNNVNKKRNELNTEQFKITVKQTESDDLPTNTKVKRISAEGKRLGQDQSVVVDNVQQILNADASNAVTSTFLSKFPMDSVDPNQQLIILDDIEQWLRGSKQSLRKSSPELSNLLDDLVGKTFKVAGVSVQADADSIASSVGSFRDSLKASLELKEEEDRKLRFAQNYLSKGDVPNPQEELTQRQISNVIASQVGQDVPNDLFIRPEGEYTTEELQMLNIVKNNPNAMPSQWKNNVAKVLTGTASFAEVETLMINTREFLFTPIGDEIKISAGALAALGSENASNLQVLYYNYAVTDPTFRQQMVTETLEMFKEPVTKEMFEKKTGSDSPLEYLNDAGIPSQLYDEFVPLVEAASSVFTKSVLKEFITQTYENRFAANPNTYSVFTGSEIMLYSPSLVFADEGEKFYEGVAKMVERLSTDEDPLFFDVNATAGVDKLREETKGIITAIPFEFFGADVTTARTQLRGDRSRVVVVDTPNTALGVREFQLGRLLINGGVEIIPNTLFNDNTPEIAEAIGRIRPQSQFRLESDIIEEETEETSKGAVGGQQIRTFKIKDPDEPSTAFEQQISELSPSVLRSYSRRLLEGDTELDEGQLDFLIETMKANDVPIPTKVREEYFKRKGE